MLQLFSRVIILLSHYVSLWLHKRHSCSTVNAVLCDLFADACFFCSFLRFSFVLCLLYECFYPLQWRIKAVRYYITLCMTMLVIRRSWRCNLAQSVCVLVSTSVEHADAPLMGGVRAVTLASRHLVEPCGSGRSRLTHIGRVDFRSAVCFAWCK